MLRDINQSVKYTTDWVNKMNQCASKQQRNLIFEKEQVLDKL